MKEIKLVINPFKRKAITKLIITGKRTLPKRIIKMKEVIIATGAIGIRIMIGILVLMERVVRILGELGIKVSPVPRQVLDHQIKNSSNS